MADVPVVPSPLSVYAGDAFSQAFVFKDDDVPEDLTSWSGWACHWRQRASSVEFMVLLVDITDAATGSVTISATPEQTRAMNGKGVFDIQASSPAVRTFLRGATVWSLDVTRD